jgi:hypothetical protein
MQTIQVGSILIEESPRMTQVLGLESEPYSGNWRLVKVLRGFALDRKIRASGWNFFFMATEVKARIFGALGTNKIQKALKRILEKVKGQHFNSLEVTDRREAISGGTLRPCFSTLSACPAELLLR